MEQLLPYEFIRNIDFVEVVINKIPSKLIEELFTDFKQNEALFFPEGLAHLKRVNKELIKQNQKLENDESFALICLKKVIFRLKI